ncbi:MAG: YwiC-like family protein [Anaerolineae bacterium]|nr:YwiC-like family protein [Anaerolineae bacterium]
MSSTQTLPANPVRLKSVAIPSEHGGWGFLLEPLILGLLLAPTAAGLGITLGTAGAFLARHPLKLAVADWRRGRRFARTRLAEQVAAAYVLIALLGLVLAIALAGPGILAPLLIAIPLGLLQLAFDFRGQSRHLLPELAGPVALATSATMIALAGGWQLQPALLLTLLLTARAIPSILYVRARLRLSKGQPAWPAAAILCHLAGVALVAALAAAGLTPWLAFIALSILTLRAAWVLQQRHRDVPARVIGFLEIGFGLLTALLIAAGYAFHL